jgi:outer membrane protein OmpA-like peptidoglycan-associated protein
MPQNPFEMPDSDIFDQMKGNPYPQAPKDIFPAPKPSTGIGGGGCAGGAAARAREEARKREEEKEWENDFVGLGEHKPEPVEDPIEIKPKATLKKVGWVNAESFFKADSEVFAEFDIPEAIKNKKRVFFQLLHKQNGVFKVVENVTGYNDQDGKVTVLLPIYKPSPETTEAIYCIKVNHCSGTETDWSEGIGTERTVNETAKPSFEHIQISGLHFSQNKSFIAPPYLKVMPKLVAEFRKWRETHDGARILIYGHAEHDEQDPKKLSTRRAEAIYSFIHNDADAWYRISEVEFWGVWEHQVMLSAMRFYQGKADGQNGPKTTKAIEGFQIFMNENQALGLDANGNLNGDTRKAMYKQYMSGERRGVDLPPIVFKDLYGTSFMGCSTYNRYIGDKEIHDENRRAGFVVVKESKNFPVYFPCRKDETTNCMDECVKPGERAIKGFGCKFYDEMVRVDVKLKVEDQSSANNSGDIDPELSSEIFLGPDEGAKIIAAAKNWIGTPYITGGTKKEGADCSGSVFGIYNEAGFPFQRVSSKEFPTLINFKPAPKNIPQIGDVGYWPGHLMIYDAEAGTTPKHEKANGWSATHPGGSSFNVARLQWFDDHYNTPVKWYRYLKKVKP